MQASPSCSLVTQAASRTLTLNQPAVSATRPYSLCSIRASSMRGRLRGVTIRAAELLCALSLATDLGSGQPLEHGLRVCAAALALAEAAEVDCEDVYCAALLHAVGCTSDAFEAAVLYGDDIAVRAGYATVDGGRPLEVVGFLPPHAGAG